MRNLRMQIGVEFVKPVYLLVTKDEFELPLAVADSMYELARICGVNPSTVMHSVSTTSKRQVKNSQYKRVWVSDSDDESQD